MIRFDPENHIYTNTETNLIVPNVTTIIKETIGAGWEASEWYKQRGRAIHACAAMISGGKRFKCDPRIQGEVDALYRFFDDYKPKVYLFETIVWSPIYNFIGTLDLYTQVQTMNTLIDWKHSIDKCRTPRQLGGYAAAAKERIVINGETSHGLGDIKYGIGVELKETGRYNTTGIIDLRKPRNEFLALNTTFRIKQECLVREPGS